MASLTIRNLDDELKALLRVEAAQHGHSMEEEVRTILRQALTKRIGHKGLGSSIHQRFAALGGVELEPVLRSEQPRQPDLA